MRRLLAEFGSGVSNVSRQWERDTIRFSFRVQGMRFWSIGRISDTSLDIDVSFPLIVQMLEGEAQRRVEAYLDAYFPKH